MHTHLAAALAIALQLSPASSTARPPRPAPEASGDEIDVSRLPAEHKARYALIRQKCGTCHPVSRATGSRLTPAAWKRHVKRMARRPGTALSDEQVERITGFLEYLSSHAAGK